MRLTRTLLPFLTLLLAMPLFLFLSCESEIGTDMELEADRKTGAVDDRSENLIGPLTKSNLPPTTARSNNPFPSFYKGFNHDTYPWADQSNPGPTGWAGTIEQHDRNSGPVDPSKGNGYATVEQGPFNDYWDDIIPGNSNAPANTLDFDLFSSAWPESGFIQKLDIYLDPDDYSDGAAFTYVNSLNALNSTVIPLDFIYFAINVNKANGALDVAGYDIASEGWYTFKYAFDSDDSGHLTVEFQLIDNGTPLHTKSIDNTFLGGVATSDYEVDELGSGYAWFFSIADGVLLPIDEQHLHPAN